MSRNEPEAYVTTDIDLSGVESRLDRMIELLEKIIKQSEETRQIVFEKNKEGDEFIDWFKGLCIKSPPPSKWESNSQ